MIKPEIKPLTGIRAAAALWVVLFHLHAQIRNEFPREEIFLSPILSNGYLGVDLFFILSGFIIYYNYSERLCPFHFPKYAEYLWMRLARIWPVHMTVLLFYAIVLVLGAAFGMHPAKPELYSWPTYIANIFLVHAWTLPDSISWNTPAWSISCEWFVYLLFPIYLALKFRKPSPITLLLLAILPLLGTALIYQWLHSSENYGLVRVVGEFFGGCGLCRIYQSGTWKDYPWQLIVPGASIAMIAACYIGTFQTTIVAYWSIFLLGLIVLGLAHDRGLMARFFSTKAMLFGGYISYSVYMVHLPCLNVLAGAAKYSHLKVIASVPVSLIAIVLVATLMFHFVEEPCRKAMRQAYPKHKQQPYPVI